MEEELVIALIVGLLVIILVSCACTGAILHCRRKKRRQHVYQTPVVITSQSYAPPNNVNQPQFSVAVQTSAISASAPPTSPQPVDNNSSMPLPYQSSSYGQNNLPYPPSPHQQTRSSSSLPYPSDNNNSQFPMPSSLQNSDNNEQPPPSYYKVKNNLV